MYILLYVDDKERIDETFDPELCHGFDEVQDAVDYYTDERVNGEDPDGFYFNREKFRYIEFGNGDLKKI